MKVQVTAEGTYYTMDSLKEAGELAVQPAWFAGCYTDNRQNYDGNVLFSTYQDTTGLSPNAHSYCIVSHAPAGGDGGGGDADPCATDEAEAFISNQCCNC